MYPDTPVTLACAIQLWQPMLIVLYVQLHWLMLVDFGRGVEPVMLANVSRH